MRLMTIDDATLHYESVGDGSPVLLVPGLGGVGSYWAPQVGPFSNRHRVVVHDHRGAGRSTFSRISYTVDQMTADLLRLMDHLGIEKAHLIGHSTGGAIGQVMAIDYPDRVAGLVLYASWTKADAALTRIMEVRKLLALNSGPLAYARAATLFLEPAWWIAAHDDEIIANEKAAAAALAPSDILVSRIDGILAFDRVEELARIAAPTLVLCAQDDRLTPPHFSEALAKAIPHARLVMLSQGGHAASRIVPDEFNRVTLDFLSDLDNGKWKPAI